MMPGNGSLDIVHLTYLTPEFAEIALLRLTYWDAETQGVGHALSALTNMQRCPGRRCRV
jgi:hypothetical protein